MAMSFEALSSGSIAMARGGGRVFVWRERAGLGVGGLRRRCCGESVVAREGVIGRSLVGGKRRARRAAALASGSVPVADETGAGGLSPKEALRLRKAERNGEAGEEEEEVEEEEDGAAAASPAPWMSEEETKAVVSEVILNEDDFRVIEYPGKEEAQPDDAHPLNSMADSLLNKINGDGRGFSLTDVSGVWKTGEEAGELNVPDLSISGFDVKDGVSPLAQWTSTELTMQHSQLARIVTDVFYMQIAFAFFGGVRVVEALLSVYSTTPPDFSKFKELLNALDPLTISWLANNVREPLASLMEADPMDLEKVVSLKSSVWQAVHAFYERQWKVMATLAMARSLSLIASHEPTTKAVTDKVQWLWNALMALPVF